MPRFATIDLGTNTAMLLIAEWDGERFTTLRDHFEITRLGKGVAARGALDPEVKARALETLRRFAALIREHQAQGVACIGTAALRDAQDGAEFRANAAEILGAPVEIISGDEEARLVARSVQGAFPSSSRRIAFDVGGGSTEIVLLEGAQSVSRRSYPIGSVKLFERVIRNDPPTSAEMEEMARVSDEVFAELPFDLPVLERPEQLIGIAGTATTLCAVVKGVEPYDPQQIHGAVLTFEEVKASLSRIAAMTFQERLSVPGLIPGRADVVLAGASVFLAVMRRLGARSMTVSDHGIRHGLFWERFAK